jgi:hypothetical protein
MSFPYRERIGLDGRPEAGSGVRKHPSRQDAFSPMNFAIFKD